MEQAIRYEEASVIDTLKAQPHTFDFNQAIIVLENYQRKNFGDSSVFAIGEALDIRQEALRIKSHVSFATPASEIQSVCLKSAKYELTVNFIGIAGVLGALATPYTEKVIDLKRARNDSLTDFLDIFNHRVASWWHRLHKKNNVGIAQVAQDESIIGRCLLRASGIGNADVLHATDLDANFFISYHETLWRQQRSCEALESLLSHYLNVPINVEEYVGEWKIAPDEEVTKIGASGQWNQLGENCILGNKVWDQMAGIILHIGPLTWAEYCLFLPHGASSYLKKIKDILHFALDQHVHVSLNLILKEDARRTVAITSQQVNDSFYLGCNTALALSRNNIAQHMTTKVVLS